MKKSIFWNTIACSPLKVNQRFGGICRFHLEGRKTGETRNMHEAGSCLLTFNKLIRVIF
jgi:hypothetical protein